jgi:hypothetical protein
MADTRTVNRRASGRFIAQPPFGPGGATRIDPTLPPLAPKALRAMGATMALSLIAKSDR